MSMMNVNQKASIQRAIIQRDIIQRDLIQKALIQKAINQRIINQRIINQRALMNNATIVSVKPVDNSNKKFLRTHINKSEITKYIHVDLPENVPVIECTPIYYGETTEYIPVDIL
jgi:hypothetical protein